MVLKMDEGKWHRNLKTSEHTLLPFTPSSLMGKGWDGGETLNIDDLIFALDSAIYPHPNPCKWGGDKI